MKGHADYFAPGQWNAICDGCGKKFKSSELRRRWDGFMVCDKEWEPRHPQDFVRGVRDGEAIPWSRPTPSVALDGVDFAKVIGINGT
jgi:hypothetical protein